MTGPRLDPIRIGAIARRHAYVLVRSPHRLFDVTVWPLVDALLFGAIGVFALSGGQERAAGYLLAGVVLWHVVYQAQISVSAGFLEETWSRNIVNLLVTPISEIEYVAGVALFGLLKVALGVALVAVSALVFYAFDVTALGLGLVPIVAILVTIGWLIALFVVGVILRFGSGAEALAWGVIFAIMPLSGVFYPLDALPEVLRPVALVLPPTHAFEAGRALVDGRGLLWGEIAIAAASSLVLAALVLAFLARMLALFRKRGYVSRFM